MPEATRMHLVANKFLCPQNFGSEDKMFLQLISICKCNFFSFHNYLLMQMQFGVLQEFIFKQVVMQVVFL